MLAKSAVAAQSVDLAPIDRLEQKIKLLITMIERLRAENGRAVEDNARLGRELEAMHARIAEAEGVGPELVALKEERDIIRSRVTEMLEQIEALDL
jgi:regulator of replication initiation timing